MLFLKNIRCINHTLLRVNEPREALKNLVGLLSSITRRDVADWEQQEKQIELRKKAAAAQKAEDQNKQRVGFAWIFVGIAITWIVGEYVLLVLSGITTNDFSLPDSVIIAMLGVGTANVLGPAFMLSKYLFGIGRDQKND